MTLQDLGSVGEFVAAIATLATLIYLATQIRQNSESVKAAAAQSDQDRGGDHDRERLWDRAGVGVDLGVRLRVEAKYAPESGKQTSLRVSQLG